MKTLVLAAPLALAVAACSGGASAGPSNADAQVVHAGPAIVIGTTLSLTGSLGALGRPLEAGYALQIADVNAAGGVAIGGAREKLRLVVLNNGSDPSRAAAQANELVRRDHAVALLGSATPLIVAPVALTAEQLHVPFVTSLMPAEAFANGDKTGWTYSWDLFSDEQQQAAAAAKALASVRGNKKVVLFTDSEPDSVVERPLYEAAFKADGLDVVGDYTFPAGPTDLASFIAAAKATGAQLLAGQLAPAGGVALWKQLASAGFRPKAAYLATAPDADSWWQSLGRLAQDTLADGYWRPGQASPGQLAAIAGTLGQKYAGSPDYATAAVAYAVAQVLTDALARAGRASPARLDAAIARTHAPTVAGLITFDPSTHTAATPSSISQWQNGALVQVQPPAAGARLDVPAAGLG